MRMLTRYKQKIIQSTGPDDLVPVDITPVAKWWSEGTSKIEWDYRKDFACSIPPWDACWFEYSRPRYVNDGGRIKELPDYRPSQRTGVVTTAMRVREEGDEEDNLRFFSESTGPGKIVKYMNNPECHWFVAHEVYMGDRNELAKLGLFADFLDKKGLSVPSEEKRASVFLDPKTGKRENHDWLRQAISAAIQPVKYSISLCHCKNVEIFEDEVPEPVQKKRRKSGKNPGKTFKCLDIDPMKKQVRRESEDGESEIERALHICRGHFKTYTEENPLFGQHTGTYWWPMHVRGHKESGEVEKSYRVNEPS